MAIVPTIAITAQTFYRTGIRLSNIITGHLTQANHFGRQSYQLWTSYSLLKSSSFLRFSSFLNTNKDNSSQGRCGNKVHKNRTESRANVSQSSVVFISSLKRGYFCNFLSENSFCVVYKENTKQTGTELCQNEQKLECIDLPAKNRIRKKARAEKGLLGSYNIVVNNEEWNDKIENKLGLSWAKLRSSWDWTLFFCGFGFSGFILIDLVWYKFEIVDLVWYIGFGELGSVAS